METKPSTFTTGTVTKVHVNKIRDNEELPNRPIDAQHVKDLEASILKEGLTVPLTVWNGGGDKGKRLKTEDGKEFPATFLIAGAHRRAAIKSILKKSPETYKSLFPNGVPVYVLGGDIKDCLTAQLRENVARKEIDMKHVLPVIKRLQKEFGMKQVEIAKAIGKSTGYISQVLDIEETLGEEAGEELSKGGISLSDARAAAKEVKEAKKSGKAVDAKSVLKKATEKRASIKAKGKQRAEKRFSAKVLAKRYHALPRGAFKLAERVELLETIVGYLAGDENADLPSVMCQDAEDTKDGGDDEKE